MMPEGNQIIQASVEELRRANFSNAAIAAAVKVVQDYAGKRNYCIDGGTKGGVLFRPDRDREIPMLAACDAGPGDKEVKLSRAMFNRRAVSVKGSGRQIALLAYEAPLARPTSELDGPGPKCDLVGVILHPWEMVAIEVKAASKKTTHMDYALVEAWVYGSFLTKIAEQEGSHGQLMHHVDACVSRYRNQKLLPSFRLHAKRKHGWQAKFAVAGTGGYFAEQLAQKDVCRNAANLLASKEVSDSFLGFLVLGGKCDDVDSLLGTGWSIDRSVYSRNALLVPLLKHDSVDLCPDTDSLARLLQ
jgi:hypothetical protein